VVVEYPCTYWAVNAKPYVLGELQMLTDMSSADWVVAGVRNFEYNVGSLLPVDFEAYARVFHPARRRAGESWVEVPWARVAAANGRVAHAGMEWIAITGGWEFLHSATQPEWDAEPSEGSLPIRQASVLAEVISHYTATPDDCWFAVWEGSGAAAFPRDGGPRVAMPMRPMVLFQGPLHAIVTSFDREPLDQRAHLWWPADRRWCVATDIDLMTTYVAGSVECITAVLADARLETFPATVDQKVTWDTDTVNPTPQRP
jgi:hypothetical protein